MDDFIPKIQVINDKYLGHVGQLMKEIENDPHETLWDILELIDEIKRLTQLNELAHKLLYKAHIDATSILDLAEKVHANVGNASNCLMWSCVDPDEIEPYESEEEHKKKMEEKYKVKRRKIFKGLPDDTPDINTEPLEFVARVEVGRVKKKLADDEPYLNVKPLEYKLVAEAFEIPEKDPNKLSIWRYVFRMWLLY